MCVEILYTYHLTHIISSNVFAIHTCIIITWFYTSNSIVKGCEITSGRSKFRIFNYFRKLELCSKSIFVRGLEKKIVQTKLVNFIGNFLKNWENINHQLLKVVIFHKTFSIFSQMKNSDVLHMSRVVIITKLYIYIHKLTLNRSWSIYIHI